MKCVIDQKRESETPVCPGCRCGLADDLRALVDAYAMLVVGEVLDGANDPVSTMLPAGTVRSGSRGAPVTGSREAPVPVNLDVVDLTLPAGPGAIYDPLGDLAAMQIGQIPVATVLDQWVRDWISYDWCPGDHLPVPTVVTLVGWLSVRLEDACDHHAAIEEFAREIRETLRACHRAMGNTPARPEHLDGIPCSGCDLMALYREPGGRYRAECGGCGKLYTDDEYERWVGLVAAQVRAA